MHLLDSSTLSRVWHKVIFAEYDSYEFTFLLLYFIKAKDLNQP